VTTTRTGLYPCAALLAGLLLLSSCAGTKESPKAGKDNVNAHATQPRGKPNPLPLPSTVPLADYEKQLYKFLDDRVYDDQPGHLGWDVDKGFRDTGPFVDGVARGTHPAVRIWYSPKVMEWLLGGREGKIADNAVMVKEMILPPSERYEEWSDKKLGKAVRMWTVMVKDSQGARDGWFWTFYIRGQEIDSHEYPYKYPESGFGNYCARCHASAEKEMTFADLHNIKGFDGSPITFYTDDSWRKPKEKKGKSAHTEQATAPGKVAGPMAEFVAHYSTEAEHDAKTKAPLAIPPVTYDHVVQPADETHEFVTSDQCLPCHSAQAGTNRRNLFLPAEGDRPETDFSPYGEWRWSPMGLAGRDPIFYAQLESELQRHPKHAAMIQNTCFSCHGVIGQRQLVADHPKREFDAALIYQVDPNDPDSRYAALARDGVSCMACHRIAKDDRPVEELFTGNFMTGPKDEIYGPIAKVQTRSMKETLGIEPIHSEHVSSSRMCANCHTVKLPVFDRNGDTVGEHLEQATYPEWLNSAYEDEYGTGTDPKSCQACHMPDTIHGAPTKGRIANVQDDQYPEAPARAPIEELEVEYREGFRRHRLLGLNALLLTMFDQFDELLGVRKADFMTGSSEGLPNALRGIDEIAATQTASIEVQDVSVKDGAVEAAVKITNKVGHRFPSGVGFRRAFLELVVLDAKGEVLWGSGRTNEVGMVLGAKGQVLPSELRTGGAYQPHYELIDSEDQVQVYEEIVKNPEGNITTGFLEIASVLKDNRFLPKGWTAKGPPGFPYAEETAPHGKAHEDKDFTDGTGSDVIRYRMTLPASARKRAKTVRATLYYQSAPPSFLRDRFAGAKGPATARLFHIASRLDVKGTRLDSWKLKIVSGEQPIK
jgi:hypothetical protein